MVWPAKQKPARFMRHGQCVSATNSSNGINAVSQPTAGKLRQDLVRLGILTEATGRMCDRFYTFDVYLDLFLK
jgi:hypothetical protein